MKAELLAGSDVGEALEVVVGAYESRRQTLTVVQVGACNGRIENDHLQEVIKHRRHVEAHLIEAVSSLYDDLVEVMAPHAKHIHCHHCAIGPRDETRVFYSVSPRFGVDNPDAPDWIKYQIGSLNRSNIQLPDEYVSVDEMQVLSPATFMSRAGIDPGNLDLLVTDAESLDGEIVRAFLDVALPEVIVYEDRLMSAEDSAALGAILDCNRYDRRVIGDDVLAHRDRG